MLAGAVTSARTRTRGVQITVTLIGHGMPAVDPYQVVATKYGNNAVDVLTLQFQNPHP